MNKKEHNKKYRYTIKGKLNRQKAQQKHIQTEKGRTTQKKAHKRWKQNNKEKVKRAQANRRRNFDWILMFPNPFSESVSVDYHHITDAYVVAIPKDLHQLYNGKYHRENMMKIVKQIYLK
jgi:ribosomal protein L35